MSTADRSYQEKRDFIRMKVSSAMTILHAGNEYQATCRDLSGAGLLAECEQAFNLGDELEIIIAQQGETHMPFNAIVEVTRVDGDPEESDNYTLGLSIKTIKN
ncbi:PilZ domain-containing protein [Oceanicoccus sp. KOV_DT_Chl]|uniref:PilZ domain-containing protein n=1 Tax=Oceanicoccus sp. KOV_DT_Chl TaxID=1904639 RepID=UPI000C7DCD7D|nr:PilZ domain-containing protein [Oceanicoccus sp. KOV_DT_Chl]